MRKKNGKLHARASRVAPQRLIPPDSQAASPVEPQTPPATRPAGVQQRKRRRSATAARAAAAVLAGIGLMLAGRIGWRWHPRTAPSAPGRQSALASSPDEARLQEAAERQPTNPGTWKSLGRFELAHGHSFAAIWAFEEAFQRSQSDASALLDLGSALESARQFHRAVEVVSEALARKPEDGEARLRLARLHIRMGEASAALATLRSAGNGAGGWPASELELGRALQLDGDLAGAIAAYRRYLALAPERTDGHIRLARALLQRGELSSARPVLETGRRRFPGDARFPFYLGLSFMPEGQPQHADEAVRYFKQALQVAPRYPLPHYFLGKLLVRQNRWPEAQEQLTAAAEAEPPYPEAHRELARLSERLGRHALALEHLGLHYLLEDDAHQAMDAFRAMQAAEPSDVRALRLLSLACIRFGRYDLARQAISQALKRQPGDAALLERLAMLALLTHSRPQARLAVETWLRKQPSSARAHWLLGRIAEDGLERPEALRQYEFAVAAEPSNPEYLAALGALLSHSSEPPKARRAVDLLQRAVQRDPGTAIYHQELGTALMQAGNNEAALWQFLAALDRDPGSVPCYTAILSLCSRLRDPAMTAFFAPFLRSAQDRGREELRLRRQVRANPADPAAQYALARFLIGQASFESAQGHLERAVRLGARDPAVIAALKLAKGAIDVQ
jgi:tetratricopeptide (TPR) repeat protein